MQTNLALKEINMIEGLGLMYGIRKEASVLDSLRAITKRLAKARSVKRAASKAIPVNPIFNIDNKTAAIMSNEAKAYLNDTAKQLLDSDYMSLTRF